MFAVAYAAPHRLFCIKIGPKNVKTPNPVVAENAHPCLPLTALQCGIGARIVQGVCNDQMPVGTRLSVSAFAHRLQVSRTPVRAALEHLARLGLVSASPTGGFCTTEEPARFADPALFAPSREIDTLFLSIARERVANRLPTDLSEADLMRRFGVTRPALLKVLSRLAEVGMVERKAGHGWCFLPAVDDATAQNEGYRLRILIEPAALLEPQFAICPKWLAAMQARHEAMLAGHWHATSSIALFEMNAEFHEALSSASGNRFFQIAIAQQNRLRRFVNYDWGHGRSRMIASCTEHLDILAQLSKGNQAGASRLLREHLENASRVVEIRR